MSSALIMRVVNESIGNADIAHSIGTDWLLMTIQAIATITNCIGLVLLGKNLLMVARLKVFHISMRLQYLNIGVALLIRSVLMTLRSVSTIVDAIVLSKPAQFLGDGNICNLQMALTTGFMNIFICSLFTFCLERGLATVFAKNYHNKKYVLVGVILIVGAWSQDSYEMINDFLRYIQAPPEELKKLPYCSSVTASTRESRSSFRTWMPVAYLGIGGLILIATRVITARRLKLHLSTTSHNLSTRFEQHQILAGSMLMFPNIIIGTIVLIVGLLSAFVFTITAPESLLTIARMKEFFSLVTAPPLIVLFPLMFNWRFASLSQSRKPSTEQRLTPISEMNHMQKFWDNAK